VSLLARGFPVNFDGGPENIAPEDIQLTRALMLIGALQAAGARVAGVNRLDPRLQIELLDELEAQRGDALDRDTRKALTLAQLRLREAKQKPGSAYRRRPARPKGG
jgi:hypothetical protein